MYTCTNVRAVHDMRGASTTVFSVNHHNSCRYICYRNKHIYTWRKKVSAAAARVLGFMMFGK